MTSDLQFGRLCRAQWLLAANQNEGESLQDQVSAMFVALRGPLFRYVFVLLRDAAEAEDSTQECFFRLFVELQSGSRIVDVKAWLFRVAHNLAIDRHRRHSERFEGSLDGAALYVADDRTLSSEEDLLQQERLALVRAALARLSPQQRLCLHLRTEGFRYREIAEILDISESTVYENLKRGLSRLTKDFRGGINP
jgi:RNA polymerase sigma-70 factor (ECF subfamily)